MSNNEKPVVKTRGVRVETHEGSVSAVVWPVDHPRQGLNHAPYVNTSEVQEIRLITRNTEYVWKKKFGQKEEQSPYAKDLISQAFLEGALNP